MVDCERNRPTGGALPWHNLAWNRIRHMTRPVRFERITGDANHTQLLTCGDGATGDPLLTAHRWCVMLPPMHVCMRREYSIGK
jgi:hypothetical protein